MMASNFAISKRSIFRLASSLDVSGSPLPGARRRLRVSGQFGRADYFARGASRHGWDMSAGKSHSAYIAAQKNSQAFEANRERNSWKGLSPKISQAKALVRFSRRVSASENLSCGVASLFKNLSWIQNALRVQNALEIPQNANINFPDCAWEK